MYAMVPCPLFGNGEKRQRGLQLGRGRACNDARLRGNDDAVCPVCLLRRRLGLRRRVRSPDIHQDEHGGREHHQVHRDALRGVPFHYRCLHRFPGLFRLPCLSEKKQTINIHPKKQ